MELPRAETSYWKKSMPKNKFPPLSKDLEVDTIVVGGGIGGLTTAYLLKKSGQKVALIEKDTIGNDSSTTINTTGKVSSQHNLIYYSLHKRFGKKKTLLYAKANQEAITKIERLITSEKIFCDFEKDNSYVYTRRKDRVDIYKKEAEYAKGLGLPSHFVRETPLPFKVEGAVTFENQAKFHVGKYISSLAKKIHGNKSYIFENSKAGPIYDSSPATVHANDHILKAKDIVVATNVPTFPLFARGAYCILEYPQNAYIVAGKTDKKLKGMYISTDKNENSILPIEDGKENLILFAGQNHITGTSFDKDSHYKNLAKYARDRFGIEKIEYKWYARDYTSYDDIPLVGKLYPWSKHLYVITAFRKWGLTNSMVSAEIIRDAINGVRNPFAKVYNPLRLSPVKNIPGVFMDYIGGKNN